MPFVFEVGKSYETQDGKMIKVLGRTELKGYECLICDDNKHRYDRTTNSMDAGRVTGTDHDYSCPDNFKRVNWFDTKEDADEWMEAEVNDQCIDNHRFAYLDDEEALKEYDVRMHGGCCGYFDATVRIKGRKATIGCNYGH